MCVIESEAAWRVCSWLFICLPNIETERLFRVIGYYSLTFKKLLFSHNNVDVMLACVSRFQLVTYYYFF